MDARRAPEGVRGAHPSDESLDLGIDGRATSARARRELGPVLAEATPLPSQDGVGSHNQEGLSSTRPRSGPARPRRGGPWYEAWAGSSFSCTRKLVAQGQVFEGELMVAAAEEGQQTEQVE